MSHGIDYNELSEQLVRGGISPRCVVRLIAELRDHHADLTETALATGMGEEDAHRQADSLLGAQDDILSDTLARQELQSWAARWPWALYGVMPPVILVATVALTLYLVVAISQVVTLIVGESPVVPAWVAAATDVLSLFLMYVNPVLLGAAICYIAIRRRSSWLWPVLGIALVAILGGLSAIGIEWGEAGHPSRILVGTSFIPPFPDILATAIRISLNLLVVLTPYVYFVRRRDFRF